MARPINMLLDLHFTHVLCNRVCHGAHPCEWEQELNAEREDGVVVAHVVVRRDHRRVPDTFNTMRNNL